MSYELLETINIDTDSSSFISFTNIPQDGTDLVLTVSGRTSATGSEFTNASLKINDLRMDTRGLRGANGQVASFAGDNLLGFFTVAQSALGTFGSNVAYISNYASTGQHLISSEGVSVNDMPDAGVGFRTGRSLSTAAVTSLEVSWDEGNLVAGSSLSLYKITAA